MRMMNSTVLSFIGDSVFELYIRRHVINKGQVHADLLHRTAVRFVRAEAQAYALKAILDELSEDEMSLVKRARNKKISTKPKNVDPVIYKWATAFEALIGFLYLSEQYDRMEEIIQKSIRLIENQDNTAAAGTVLRKGKRQGNNGGMAEVKHE
ncbi:MAG: ribonuclease III domain-containing protein [Eubacteriales bacterium]|nr:ribonuclease III domain-containing protein [Eubacteriales bacterium]